jgi:CBS domain-containing protein
MTHHNHLKVSDIMTTAVTTIHVGDTVTDADAEMRIGAIRHLPVVDEHQRLVGILSNRDLLGALAKTRGKTVHVAEVMTRNVKTIRASAPARQAAAIMLEHTIGSVPVIGDEGQLVGMVTETDFLRFAYEQLGGV